jgi:hypothetical protein
MSDKIKYSLKIGLKLIPYLVPVKFIFFFSKIYSIVKFYWRILNWPFIDINKILSSWKEDDIERIVYPLLNIFPSIAVKLIELK